MKTGFKVKRLITVSIFFVFILAFSIFTNRLYAYQGKVIYIKKVNSFIKIDGILDEPEWNQSIPSGDFIQQEPNDGRPATEKTVVRVIRDDINLYFGITCYDSQPDKIISNEMRRDAYLFNNDNIEIFLDTFNDKKNCYYFRTNPSGARYDAIVTDEGKNLNYDWNTIWRCSARKNSKGWVVEIAIPFYAIRFKDGLDTWGINFGREIRRKNEKTFWSYIPRGLGMNGKYRVSLFGKMVGLKGLTKGKNLEAIPYVNGGETKGFSDQRSSTELDGGMDIRYRITGNLRADFSYNTDFAQVEADQEVVNVTRFNLFFPEKRGFFLENAGLLQFGDVNLSDRAFFRRIVPGSSGEQCGYLLYYSRRIGLKKGKKIPLYGGTKLAGKIGKNVIGFMTMQTKETKLSENNIEPSTNYTVFRLKHDVFSSSNIGFIFLNKQSAYRKYNRAAGIDCNFPLTPSFTMGGSLAKTVTPNFRGKDYAGTLFMDYKTDVFSWKMKYLSLGDNFNPEMGFIKREKIKSAYTSATFTKWLNNYWFRNISFSSSLNYVTNNRNELETRRLSGSLKLRFSSGDDLDIGIYDYYEYLEEDDLIRTVVIPSGDYKFNNYWFYFNANHSRIFAGGIRYSYGNYYGGIKRTFSPHYHFRPSPHFVMDTYYDYNHIVLPNGRFYSNVLSSRITYMFSPDVYIKAYIQWNDLDNRLSTNILFHYIHNAVNNFYIVYNENRNPDTPQMNLKDRMIMVKFVYHLFI